MSYLRTSGNITEQVTFQLQPDAIVNQANPVSGTPYAWKTAAGVLLGTQRNVRIIAISASVTWTVQPSPLEVRVTIDGVVLNAPFVNPATATPYYAVRGPFDTLALNDTDFTYLNEALLEGRSVLIEFETTGGTVSNLSGNIKWAKRTG